MASLMYNEGATRLQANSTSVLNWTSDTIKIAAVAAAYTPNKDDQFESTITSNVIGTAQTLGTKTGPTKNTGTDRVEWFAANPTWTALAAGSTIAGFVVYDTTPGNATTNPLICYIDTTDTPTNGGNITLDFASAAVFYLQQ